MRMVVSVSTPEFLLCHMEWRLKGQVTTIGDLLVKFGGKYTAARIFDFYWSLHLRSTKRSLKKSGK